MKDCNTFVPKWSPDHYDSRNYVKLSRTDGKTKVDDDLYFQDGGFVAVDIQKLMKIVMILQRSFSP